MNETRGRESIGVPAAQMAAAGSEMLISDDFPLLSLSTGPGETDGQSETIQAWIQESSLGSAGLFLIRWDDSYLSFSFIYWRNVVMKAELLSRALQRCTALLLCQCFM